MCDLILVLTQIYWSNNGVQERLLSLVEYSTPTNFEWRTASVLIPATGPVETRVSLGTVSLTCFILNAGP